MLKQRTYGGNIILNVFLEYSKDLMYYNINALFSDRSEVRKILKVKESRGRL